MTKKVYCSVFTGAALSLAMLVSPVTVQAKDMDVIRQSDGGFVVEFPNGCSVEYDRYGNRGRDYGRCKERQFERADDGVRAELNSDSYDNDPGTWYGRLVGASEDGAENQMDVNGFRYVDSFDSGRNSRGTVWYNNSSRQCLQMITVNGRVDSVVDIRTHPKCNSHGGGYGSDNGNWYTRLVGASDDGAENQMDIQGFRRVDSFDSGRNGYGTVWFNAGNRQCLQMIVVNGRVESVVDIHTHPNCKTRREEGYSDDGSWYGRLVGASFDGAENQLNINGFRQVDSFASGRDGYGTIWYNRSERQCLQIITVDGRVDSSVDIGSHPSCR